MAQVGNYTFDWINDAQVLSLLGNPRPKTLQDIQNDPGYWGEIFGQWVAWKDSNGAPGVKQIYDQWLENPQGEARDQLKKAGNGDLRQEFYDAVGEVKAARRQHEIDSGEAEKRIDDALGI